MPARMLTGAMCVQRFDDSLNSAIHITYRISLRSSSMPEPRDPLLKVLIYFCVCHSENTEKNTRVWGLRRAPGSGRRAPGRSRRSNDRYGSHKGLGVVNSVMIPPLVHQRRPCYDFYFL
jgi:hypothetical protein